MKRKTSLGGDALRLTLSKVITLCISMACTMLLSRFRTTEEYGTYSQLLLVVNLFTSLFMLGLPNSINYFLSRAENEQERQKFLSVYYTLSTLLSVVMGIVLVLAIPLIEAYFKNPALRGFLYFLAIYPWANVVSSSIENILIVYQKTGFVKYDAFREMSGKLSYALALLDKNNNGILINSMYSREGCYSYTKEIRNGESSINLSEEEEKALKMAVNGDNM